MIEPKDGEWWVCTCDDYEQVLMLKGGIWVTTSCGKVGAYSTDIINPLYKMVKAEEPKPRTKTVYEKVEYEKAWEAVKHFEDGGELWTNFSENGYRKIDSAPDVLRYLYKLYKQVQKEIDWKDEVKVAADDFEILCLDNDFRDVLTDDRLSCEFIKICHLVASLTDKPE